MVFLRSIRRGGLAGLLFIFAQGGVHPATVKCLFSFYIQSGRFRGGRLVSDRTILHRGVRYFGRVGGFSGGYLVRFRFFRPVTPVAGRTDGGSAYIRIDGKQRVQVPESNKDFTGCRPGRIIDFYTAVRPKYVQLIVRGEGRIIKGRGDKKRGRDPFPRGRLLGGESASSVAAAFRKAFRQRSATPVLGYFRKTRVFVRHLAGSRTVRGHQDGERAAVLFTSKLKRALSVDVRAGYRSVMITLRGVRGGSSRWLVEKRGVVWKVTGCRLVPFGLPGQGRRRY